MRSKHDLRGLALRAGVVVFGFTAHAAAQCTPGWIPAFDATPGVSDTIRATAVFDDGSGAALYVGGAFVQAGGMSAARVARWNGAHWSALGAGVDGEVRALAIFDDGTGPALYAGGAFTTAGGVAASHVARWNGVAWSALGAGTDGDVKTLAVFDDGTGPALYAGGVFTMAGGVAAPGVARWNGAAWSAVGGGVTGSVNVLRVAGSGPQQALYAGGVFAMAGAVAALNVARWDGTAWSALGAGVGGGFNVAVQSMGEFDEGQGPVLFVGGHFATAGVVAASNIARWDGMNWSAVGGGVATSTSGVGVAAMRVFDDGNGPRLYVAGDFTTAGGLTAQQIATWNGAVWSPLGSGVLTPPGNTPKIFAFETFDDTTGGGVRLYVAGQIQLLGGVDVNGIAKWTGTSYEPLGKGLGGAIIALRSFDDGSGPALFAGGMFRSAGGVPLNFVGKWNGTAWTPLGIGANFNVWDFAVFDDRSGSGPALYMTGDFGLANGVLASRIAKWTGTTFQPLAGGLDDDGSCLTVYDDGNGPALYCGGIFQKANGITVKYLARWNGTKWTSVGGGLGGGVGALAVYDDGVNKPALYVAGGFTSAGGQPAKGLAKWDGSWTAIPGLAFPGISAIKVFDDGSGSKLFAGGNFTTIGGMHAARVARWDGQAWTTAGAGLPGNCIALEVHDDGSGGGPALFAAWYLYNGTVFIPHVSRWDGTNWIDLNGDFTAAYVNALATFDAGDGLGAHLYAGGTFKSSTSGDSYLTRFGCPGHCGSITAYGAGCEGSGHDVPTLSVTGCPTSGGAVTLRVEHALGGSVALLLLGTQQAALPAGFGCTLYVSPILTTLGPLPLSGAAAGQGTLQSTVILPALPNATLTLSAACADPGLPPGFTLTNGIAMTILN